MIVVTLHQLSGSLASLSMKMQNNIESCLPKSDFHCVALGDYAFSPLFFELPRVVAAAGKNFVDDPPVRVI